MDISYHYDLHLFIDDHKTSMHTGTVASIMVIDDHLICNNFLNLLFRYNELIFVLKQIEKELINFSDTPFSP